MLQDPKIMQAVSRIIQRSERQEDVQKLIGTYVDVGLLPQLNNNNHQIFYGRRGTGKTHVMKVLESTLASIPSNTVVYIDCRTLGSSSQFSDFSLSIQRRCLALFRDILLAIYHDLMNHIIEVPSKTANEALSEVDALAGLVTEPSRSYTLERVVAKSADEHRSKKGESATVTIGAEPEFNLGSKSSRDTASSSGREIQYTVTSEDKVLFPDLQRSLRKVLELADTKLYILIDEWSSLPVDVQPYLAEFLKRGIVPLNTATLKISALEYRSRFSEIVSDRFVGFELGADIATAPDLDDYFVFDRNPGQVADVYADVLFRHLSSELPENYLRDTYGMTLAKQLPSKLFTERPTFVELARASEGVIRDLINIFTQAFFNAQKRGRTSIDKRAVMESAQQWFEQDKSHHLDEKLQDVLRRVVDDVIGQRKARSFLLPRQLEKHPVIQRLFDARVLHHMQRGYADKDNPGVRYNIYAIDFGAYIDLIGTSKEPELDLQADRGGTDYVVPFDDKRSIRRIILNEKILEH